jgi:DNA-binding transcriptional regulator YiaG
MEARPDRKTGVTDWIVSVPDIVHAPFEQGGKFMQTLNVTMAPKPKEVTRMLKRLRAHHRWSQAFAAGVFGVDESTITKWETGRRNPGGVASKFIFLLHALLIEKRKLNCFDLAVWGQLPGASIPLAAITEAYLELHGTFFIPSDFITSPAKKPSVPPDKK